MDQFCTKPLINIKFDFKVEFDNEDLKAVFNNKVLAFKNTYCLNNKNAKSYFFYSMNNFENQIQGVTEKANKYIYSKGVYILTSIFGLGIIYAIVCNSKTTHGTFYIKVKVTEL